MVTDLKICAWIGRMFQKRSNTKVGQSEALCCLNSPRDLQRLTKVLFFILLFFVLFYSNLCPWKKRKLLLLPTRTCAQGGSRNCEKGKKEDNDRHFCCRRLHRKARASSLLRPGSPFSCAAKYDQGFLSTCVLLVLFPLKCHALFNSISFIQ